VLGCDGTPVNTGVHTGTTYTELFSSLFKLTVYTTLCSGALRQIQLELKQEMQQVVCLLHLNELFLRHRQVPPMI
jgi:hypothetical protein